MTTPSEPPHYLYRILFPDGRVYVGVALDPKVRFSGHRSGTLLVDKAIRRFGPDRCILQVLCKGSKHYIYALEKRAIQQFNTSFPDGYNCTGRNPRWSRAEIQRRFISELFVTPPTPPSSENELFSPPSETVGVNDASEAKTIRLQFAGHSHGKSDAGIATSHRDLCIEAKHEQEILNTPKAIALKKEVYRAIGNLTAYLDGHNCIWDYEAQPARLRARALTVVQDFEFANGIEITLKHDSVDRVRRND